MPTAPLRVAIVAYSPLVRLGLAGLLATHPRRAIVVDQAASDGHLGHHDVAIYDLTGLAHGSRDLQHLVASNTAVVGLLPREERELARRAAEMRVTAVVPIDITAEDLVEAVESAALAGAESAEGEGDPPPATAKPWGLSGREVEILRLIADGLPNLQIAQQLYLSPNSVKTYIRSAYRKIGAATRSQAVLWVLRHGLAEESRSPSQDARSR
jgi:DNA-binding NarL/FixJ family response regulator